MTLSTTASGAEARSRGLGERLRQDTLDAHRAAEAAFDLPARLGSPDDYAGALGVMDAFHAACAPALSTLEPWLPPTLRDGHRHRRARIAADLERLGRVPTPRPPALTVNPRPDPDPDAALGVLYVVEGSALGGLVIAAEVRRRLPSATQATSFFTGEGRATAARWRAVQAVLAGWPPERSDRVLAGARSAFDTFLALAMTAPIPSASA